MLANYGGLRATRKQRVSKATTIPAPVGGWDAASPIANMPADCAVYLENYIPRSGYVEIRRGYIPQCDTGTAAAVNSLMVYNGQSSSKLFAASSTKIIDVTSSTPSDVVTGLTDSKFQYVNFTTSGGHFLWICNGADAPRHYNGSTWATPSITGITSANIINVCSHKGRLWFVLKNSMDVAYLSTGTIAGAATTFPLGQVFDMGGYVMAMGTWSIDGGDGADDYAVFISSEGQVAIYQGTDPSSIASWGLKGVYNLGNPIGRRCFTKFGSDLAIITLDGVVPLSTAINFDRAAIDKTTLTNKISPVMNSSARSYRDNFGWELIGYPKGTLAILNVPVAQNTTIHQYVMNTITGAWCKFKGINANCWAVMDDNIYFGGISGVVNQWDVGGSDYTASISYKLKTAFNYLKSKGNIKQIKEIRPLVEKAYSVNYALSVDVDFKDTSLNIPTSSPAVNSSKWGVAKWGVGKWSISGGFFSEWNTVTALGHSMAIKMGVEIRSQTVTPDFDATSDVLFRIYDFTVIYEDGGLL